MLIGARQINFGNAVELPYDAEVEYLTSNGNQYIDTLVVPVFPCIFSYFARVSFANTTNRQIMGLQGGMYFGVVQGKYQAAQGGTGNVGATVRPNVFYDYGITFNKTSSDPSSTSPSTRIDWSLDYRSGVAYEAVYYFLPANSSIWIFVANNATTLRGTSSISYFRIEMDGEVVRDFIPVRVGSGANAVGYMYDRVTGTLFGNQGTGAFLIGPDVK